MVDRDSVLLLLVVTTVTYLRDSSRTFQASFLCRGIRSGAVSKQPGFQVSLE